MSFRPQHSNSISLEYEIEEARRGAEDFSKSLQNTRKEETESMRAVEEERRRWAASYEEKTVMIEQLQRELASTVEALQVERSSDKAKLYTVEPNRSNLDSIRDITRRGMEERAQSEYSNGSNESGTRAQIGRELTSHSAKNQFLLDEVNSLKEQMLGHQRVESSLRSQIDQLLVELEHTKNAWRDSEGKLQFRSNQVRHLESEKDARDKIEADLREKIRQLDKTRMSLELDAKVHEACKEESNSTLKLQLAAAENKIVEMERKRADLECLVDMLSQERDRLVLRVKDMEESQRQNAARQAADEAARARSAASTTVSHDIKKEQRQVMSRWENHTDDTHDDRQSEQDSQGEHDDGTAADDNDAVSHSTREKTTEPEPVVQNESKSAAKREPIRIPSPGPYAEVPTKLADHSRTVKQAPRTKKPQSVLDVPDVVDGIISSTATHAILDMQAYSPPRVLLQSKKRSGDFAQSQMSSPTQRSAASISVLESNPSVGSPPCKGSRRTRGGALGPSPSKKSFPADIADIDDHSEDILCRDDDDDDEEEEGNTDDDIMLHSPDRNLDGIVNGRKSATSRSKGVERQVGTPSTDSLLEVRRIPLSQRRNSAGSQTLPSTRVARQSAYTSKMSTKAGAAANSIGGHSARSKKVYDVAGYKASLGTAKARVGVADMTSKAGRRSSVASFQSATSSSGERRVVSSSKSKVASANMHGRKSGSVSRDKRTPTGISSSQPPMRSQSAPTRNRPAPPVATALPNSKQKKITLLEAKHATTRARVAPTKPRPSTDRTGLKTVEGIYIPRSSAKKKSIDLSLSLNST